MSADQRDVVAIFTDALQRASTGAITTAMAVNIGGKVIAFVFQVGAGTALAALGLQKI